MYNHLLEAIKRFCISDVKEIGVLPSDESGLFAAGECQSDAALTLGTDQATSAPTSAPSIAPIASLVPVRSSLCHQSDGDCT